MKQAKRLSLVVLAALLALAFAACSPRELATKLVVAVVGEQDDSDEEEAQETKATAGGSFSFPEGFDTTSRLTTNIQDGCLYVSFNGIQTRSTGYFSPSASSVTINSYATTDSTKILEYKVALWKLGDDQRTTSYVDGTTVYYATGGDCSTYTVTGLDPSAQYKLVISYDSTASYITGGVQVTNVASDTLTEIEGDTASST